MRLASLCLSVCLLGAAWAPALANDQTGPEPDLWVHVRDDVRGDVDGSRRFCVYATEGSKLTVTLRPDDADGPPGAGLSLQLFAPNGLELIVAGTRKDRSNPKKDLVRWSGVKLADTGVYTLVASAQTAGEFRLTFKGALAKARTELQSTEPLASGDTVDMTIDAAAGSNLKTRLTAVGKAGFVGELVSVVGPDAVPLFIPEDGPVVLTEDGVQTVTIRNAGGKPGNWKAVLNAKPVRPRRMLPLLRGPDVYYVPQVDSVDPTKVLSQDTQAPLTILGHEFAEDVDVRLLRKGRPDILAENVSVISSEEIRCTVDMDTKSQGLQKSSGNWNVVVFNDPAYGVPGDRSTLDQDTYLRSDEAKVSSVGAGTVTLPKGVKKDTEVWEVRFIDAFQGDLNRMGLGSEDPELEYAANFVVQTYTIAYLRDLFRTKVTTGDVKDELSVPISFVLKPFPSVAGQAGEDYNRIDVGGAYGYDEDEDGNITLDPEDPTEPLLWGYAPYDDGNVTRQDLVLFADDGSRVGMGARTRILDPDLSTTSDNFKAAMFPLRSAPLRTSDRRYFITGFRPRTTSEAQRYQSIVLQLERAAREVAAIVAHHIGKAMGLPNDQFGPMANPDKSGDLWTLRSSLDFNETQITEASVLAVPNDLPGKGGKLDLAYFALNGIQPPTLPTIITDNFVVFNWEYVGGRVNAVPEDYRVQYIAGSHVPFGMQLTFVSLSGTPPLLVGNPANNVLYCRAAIIDFLITDTKSGLRRRMTHRLNIIPDLENPKIKSSPALTVAAQNCINAVTSQ